MKGHSFRIHTYYSLYYMGALCLPERCPAATSEPLHMRYNARTSISKQEQQMIAIALRSGVKCKQ